MDNIFTLSLSFTSKSDASNGGDIMTYGIAIVSVMP